MTKSAPGSKIKKGQVKNPKGRPKGSLNKHSIYQLQLEEHADAWIKRLHKYILEGDKECLRFALRYVLRKEKDAPMTEIELIGTPSEKLKAIHEACSMGKLTENEARTYIELVKAEV